MPEKLFTCAKALAKIDIDVLNLDGKISKINKDKVLNDNELMLYMKAICHIRNLRMDIGRLWMLVYGRFEG